MLEKANSVRFIFEHCGDLGTEDDISLVLEALDVLATLSNVEVTGLALEMAHSLIDLLAALVHQHGELPASSGEVLHRVNDDLKSCRVYRVCDALKLRSELVDV